MTQESVKQFIKEKFGTMSKFSRRSKYDRQKLQILFAVKYPEQSELEKVHKLAEKTEVGTAKDEISPKILKRIEKVIEKAGGIRKFCEDHPEFPEPSVYQILDGSRTKISKKVKALCKVLGVKL